MVATICLTLLLTAPQGMDWPQYRGPNQTAAIASRDWSPTGQDKPLWSKNVGKGYSCPSIINGRLVTIGFDEKAAVDRIVCLNAQTGEEHWQYEFAAIDKPEYHGGGTLTTPTIQKGRVYCLSRAGKFHVLELASGKLVWSRDYKVELKLEDTFHGFCASPLLEQDRIYLQFGGLVAAVSTEGGKVLWQTEDHGDLAYSNLAMLKVSGTPALGAVLGMAFFVLKREDGKVLHKYPWRLKGNAVHCATPIAVGKDRVFLSTAYNKGCAMLRFGTDKEPEMVWGNRRMRNKVTACVQHEDHLYGFDESMLRCIDLNGKSKWRARGLGLGSLSMAGGRLLVLNSDGELIIAEATPEEFRELSRKKVLDGGVYWTMPVLVDGLIYVRNSLGDMRCLDHRLTGAEATSIVTAPTKPSPSATTLFARHAKLVTSGAFVQKGKALRLRGTWGIPLRGLEPEPMTLMLVAPDRWDLRLDEGGLLYTFTGDGAWAIEPQGPRTIEGDELLEMKQLFPLPELFAPTCPKGAVTKPRIIRFAETQCWKVTSSAGKSFYFHSETGRLIGSEGDGISTLVFHGSQHLGGLTLPKSITRFRADDGQEHVMVLTAAKWIEPPAKLFALPPAIKRIMRTPAELLRDTAALQKRFAKALGRYQAKDKSTPLRDDVITLRVRDGELWFATPEPSYRVRVEEEADGVFALDGPPVRFSIKTGEKDRVTALEILLPGGRKLPLLRLPK